MNLKQRIVILSWDVSTRKTHEMILGLKGRGYKNLTWLGMKFVPRPWKPLYQHRPPVLFDIPVEEFCKNHGIEYIPARSYTPLLDLNPCLALVSGARILSEEVTARCHVLNAHPAILPWVRGLDALKWSILKGVPLGVTSYRLNGLDGDTGWLIDQKILKIKPTDTYHSIAYRLFDLEVEMIVDAVQQYNPAKEGRHVGAEVSPLYRRMPHELELSMMMKVKQLIRECSK